MPEGNTFDPYQDVLLKLPEEAQRLLITILQRNPIMDPSTSRKIKDVCGRYEKELEQFGLIPDYYAYALIYWATLNEKALKGSSSTGGSARDLFGPHSIN